MKTKKRFLSILLSLVMVLGLMPGMSLTAYADDPYSGIKNKTTVVKFDGKDWYLIDYDSSTVTLLAKDCVGASAFGTNQEYLEYSGSTVETAVNSYYTDSISTDAKTAVNGGMFLLTNDQANTIENANPDVLKCSQATGAQYNYWWLSSRHEVGKSVLCVAGESGGVYGEGANVTLKLGVRPALQLDLSKVTFDSTTKTFSLKPAVTEYPLWVGGVQVTDENRDDLANSHWSYTPATTGDNPTPATLTLNGYSCDGVGYKDAAIYAEGDLVIDVRDDSSVTGPAPSGFGFVWQTYGVMLGTGTLTVRGPGTLTARGGDYSGQETATSCGVLADNIVVEQGASLVAEGGKSTMKSQGAYARNTVSVQGTLAATGGTAPSESVGLGSCETITVAEGGTLTATGGASDDSYGVYTYGSVNVGAGARMTAAGGKAAVYGTVKNAIAGTGWTDTEGTTGKAAITVSEAGQTLNSYKKIQFPAVHDHSFTYTSTGDMITATCSKEGCTLPKVGEKHIATLTIVMPTMTTYGGTGSAAATITDENSIKGEAEVKYFNATKSGETYTKTGDALIAAPTNAGNYVAEITLGEGTNEATASVGYTIAPKSVTVTGITAENKVYDGNTEATLNCDSATIQGKVDGDEVTLSNTATGSFSDKNVGSGKTVTITGLTLTGNDAANYTLASQPEDTTATITARSVTVTGITAQNKVYDGSTNAVVNCESAVINGKVENDDLSFNAPAGSFSDKNVANGKTVSFSGLTLSGSDSINYTLASQPASVTADIAAKPVTVSGITASNKTYDGTTDATLDCTNATLSGKLEDDNLTVTATGAFEDANVGDKTVNLSDLTLGGTDKDNYVLAATGQQTTANATIYPKSISDATVTLDKTQLTYNGSEQTVNVTDVTTTDGMSLTENTDYIVNGNTGIDKNDYTVTVTGLGNFTNIATANWKIVEKAMTVKADNVTVTYDGKEHGIKVEVSDPESGAEVKYGTTEDTYDLDECPTIIDSGTMTVYYKVTAGSNYSVYTGKAVVTVEKHASTAANVTANDREYDGTEKPLVNVTGEATGGEMQYAIGTDATTAPTTGYTTSIPTATDAGTYYVWYKVVGDENHNDSVPACVTTKILAEISATVTFKVVNGSWNEGEGEVATADKTVTLTGYEGDTLKFAADQIPAAGSKPGDTYKAGSWDVTPSADTAITEDTTYTYTYVKKDSISKIVTFKVANGSWDDGTTADKTVTLTGYEGDTLKLAADQIPAVGTKPGDTYKTGSWNVTPSADTEITADTTYTYTYAKKDSVSKTVIFKVVNGSWDNGTTADKKVTLTGYVGDKLKLAADQIPAVGSKPGDTYKAGSWNVTPSADTEITADTTYTYTYVKEDVPVVVAPEKEDELSINAGFKVTQKGSKITIKWGKVKGATGYEVYAAYCGKNFSKIPAKRTTTKTSVAVSKIGGKKINLKKNFKVYVKAIKKDGNKSTQLAKTMTGHIVGRKNTKYTNAKSITLLTKTIDVEVGKTYPVNAKTVLVSKKKKQLSDDHATEFRYASANESIATVDKKGNVKGISAGTTKIYVYSRNGLAKAVSVTVK